jgi:hypothetical protein
MSFVTFISAADVASVDANAQQTAAKWHGIQSGKRMEVDLKEALLAGTRIPCGMQADRIDCNSAAMKVDWM